MEKSFLKQQWDRALKQYNIDNDKLHEYFIKVLDYYNKNGHFYHNLNHIENFLRNCLPYLDACKYIDEIILAVFYHDAVYDSLRTDNEEKSAQLARTDLKELGLDKNIRIRIMELIRRTANHTVRYKKDRFEMQLFLDGDIAILGSNWELYKEYANAIRKEYIRIPDRIFKKKRKKFLLALLKEKKLFYVPEFKEKYEAKARENILKEINEIL